MNTHADVFLYLQLLVLWCVLEEEVVAVRVGVCAVKDGVVWTVVQHSVLRTVIQRENTAMSRESACVTLTGMA